MLISRDRPEVIFLHMAVTERGAISELSVIAIAETKFICTKRLQKFTKTKTN